MPVPAAITDLSVVPVDNSPQGSDNVFPDLDDHLRAHAAFIRQNYNSLLGFGSTSDAAMGAALVGLNPTLNYAAGTIGARLRDQVSVRDHPWLAAGDGVADDSAAITACITYAQGVGADVVFPRGTYKCIASRIDLTASGICLIGHGATLDFSGLTELDGSVYKFIKVAGAGFGAAYSLTADAVVGSYTATLDPSDAANFVAGDWVQVTAEDAYSYGAATVKKGEIKQIHAVSSGIVTFRQALYDSYTTANTARLRKVTFIENVGFEGLTIVGKNTEANADVGIEIEYVNRFHVRGCRFKDIDQQALRVYNSIRGDIDGNWFDGVRYTGPGLLFYGIVLWNGAQWINVRNNHGHELRHLVTTSATATKYGEPFFYTVTGNICENAMAGSSQASWAYENHGFGRFGVWANNIADSCHTGINLEKGDQIVVGNIFRNCRANGIYCDTDARELRNLLITSNHISRATNDSVSGSFFGFAIPASASQVRENIRFSGNIIEGFGTASRSDYGVRIYTGNGKAKNCVISDNVICNNGAYESTDFGTYIEQGGWRVCDNVYRDYERTISVVAGADDVTVADNEIIVTSRASTQTSVAVSGNNALIAGNVFRGVYRPISISAGANGTKVAGNSQFDTAVTAVSDSGTGTVFNFGAVSGF